MSEKEVKGSSMHIIFIIGRRLRCRSLRDSPSPSSRESSAGGNSATPSSSSSSPPKHRHRRMRRTAWDSAKPLKTKPTCLFGKSSSGTAKCAESATTTSISPPTRPPATLSSVRNAKATPPSVSRNIPRRNHLMSSWPAFFKAWSISSSPPSSRRAPLIVFRRGKWTSWARPSEQSNTYSVR